jgi:hypothetical protein
MDVPALTKKLMEIERALETRDVFDIRNMILSAQNGLLQLERENEELALQNAGLRRSLNAVRNSSRTIAAPSHSADDPDADFSASAPGSKDDSNQRTWRTTHFFFSN